MPEKTLDVIAIGRAGVDLYGQQIGGRLEDMSGFAKYLGGSPANTSVGASRLGLKSALISGVGDEHMGRFITEQLEREGVETSGVKTFEEALTALVILGIRDEETFPLIFYRQNCADMKLTEADIDPDFIASSRSVVLSGTHFSTPETAAMSTKAAKICRDNGGRVAFDIDYRPVLWGIGGLGSGEERFVADDGVTEHLQTILPLCDLVVGTEEELHIAAGTTDTLAAIKKVRELTTGAIVCKRGADGCVVFPDAIPDSIEDGITGPGFPIEVFNVLGAGDAFMSGFLRGWVREEPWETCAKYANACGAFAVSRHGCAPAIPSWAELEYFFENGSSEHALRKDEKLNQVHWATNRRKTYKTLMALAIDHRIQFEHMAEEIGADVNRVGEFKQLALTALRNTADGREGFGTLLDGRLGEAALHSSMEGDLWVARPVELPQTRPLQLEIGTDYTAALSEWPVDQVVKCLVPYHPNDDAEMREAQEQTVIELATACKNTNHELLVEIIASPYGEMDTDTTAIAMKRFYDIGVYPDWWKLEPAKSREEWATQIAVIEEYDTHCHGIIMLGLEAPIEQLQASFAIAAEFPQIKGFAIGRSIFGDVAKQWLGNEIDNGQALATMQERFESLVSVWQSLKSEG